MAGKISLYAEAAAKLRDRLVSVEGDVRGDAHLLDLLRRLDDAAKHEIVHTAPATGAAPPVSLAEPGACIPLPRQSLLREAYEITSHDRNSAYGNPEDNFANIAAYWNSYCQQRFKVALDITPQDVAHFMILMKMARLATNASHRDSLVDIAGYAACAEDCRSSKLPKAHSA